MAPRGVYASRAMSSQRPGERAFRVAILAVLVLMAALSPITQSHVRAASLLLRFSGGPEATGFATVGKFEVDEQAGTIETPTGPSRIRVYTPRGVTDPPGMVLVHGVHRLGVEEPRLARFSRAIASSGVLVLTPEIKELCDYRIDARSVATIGAGAKELAKRVGRARVGVMGMSFAGGLSILAAADPEASSAIAFVVSVGGHHDLARVLRFFAKNEIESPDGVVKMHAHDYGALVLAYGHAEDFFPKDDVPLAKDALRTWLWGDPAAAKKMAEKLSPPGRARMKLFEEQREDLLAPDILAVVAKNEDAMRAVSPRYALDRLRVPVFVLHGAGDNVIPPSESLWVYAGLPAVARGGVLVSPAIQHVELSGKPSAREQWDVVHFMADVLQAAWSEPR